MGKPLHIFDVNSQVEDTGIRFRRITAGPEWNLVSAFLSKPRFHHRSGYEVVVFVEPKIESGYPDLVIVWWQTAAADHWSPKRSLLTTTDLRVMHFIHQVPLCSIDELNGSFSQQTQISVERLLIANMIIETKGRFVSQPLYRNFALRDLIAVEAKIADPRSVTDQACLNQWFASTSVILIPGPLKSSHFHETVEKTGIFVITQDEHFKDKVPVRDAVSPQSYVAWQFNEWTWRALRRSRSSEECR